MTIPEKLQALRAVMKANGIDIYVVPTDDFHQSEYVGEHFKARAYITGFTGSAGTAVITLDEAGLWTDGRYFLQADKQLEGTTITLRKMGEPGVPTIPEYLAEALPSGGTLGVDGRVISVNTGDEYEKIAADKGGKIQYHQDLIDQIWTDRPELSREPVFALGVEYAGETTESKLTRIREEMKKNHADKHVLTTLDDICWTLNIRGNDVEFFPLVLSYAVITMDSMELYIDESKLDDELKASLSKDGVHLHPYNDIYEDIKKLDADTTLLLDKVRLNYALYKNIPEQVTIVDVQNPEILFKALKNETEIENIRKAQIKDSIAHVRFMKWVKEVVLNKEITEHDAEAYLEELRRSRRELIDLSFSTICAYKENAAMMHYNALNGKNTTLKDEGMILVDSGGHYLYGTTDITRTISLGHPTKEEKLYFTTVLKSVIDLADTVFLKGCNGQNLDIKARAPIWKMLIDYKCGTGHGVGHILSVHEAPNGFRWQIVKERNDSAPLLPGMITTDEPGIYLEGKLGIRTENELLCKEVETNEWGTFYGFETITYAPIDLDLIDANLLTQDEKHWLNDYHKMVFENLSPYLDDNTKKWLKKYTKAI